MNRQLTTGLAAGLLATLGPLVTARSPGRGTAILSSSTPWQAAATRQRVRCAMPRAFLHLRTMTSAGRAFRVCWVGAWISVRSKAISIACSRIASNRRTVSDTCCFITRIPDGIR